MSMDDDYQALRKAYEGAEVGRRIKVLRLAFEHSQSSLARHLNMSPNAISQMESGISRPATDVEIRLKAAFGLTIDWVRFGEMAGMPPELIRRIEEVSRAISKAPAKPKGDPRSPPKKPKTIASPVRRRKKRDEA